MPDIYCCDCVEGSLKHMEPSSVDLIICDPPFGIGESSFGRYYNRDNSNVVEGYVEIPDKYDIFSMEWIGAAKRILKETGSMYIVSGWTNLADVLNAIDRNNLFVINHIIWKFNFGVFTRKKFVTSHYHILYVKKDKKFKVTFNKSCRFASTQRDQKGGSLVYQDMEDVWVINKEYHRGKKKNNNKLPESLVAKMIQYSSNERDVVCDFFLGNFTTAIVAKKLRRKFCGFEINKKSFDLGMKTLEETKEGDEVGVFPKKEKKIDLFEDENNTENLERDG